VIFISLDFSSSNTGHHGILALPIPDIRDVRYWKS
jgi:hypothetical protein